MGESALMDEREAVWKAYQKGSPIRVPCTLIGNTRIFIQDQDLNTDGITFEEAATDPEAHVLSNLKYHLYRRTVLNQFSDDPIGLPERWTVNLEVFNVFEAAYFGADVDYTEGQVPDTLVPFAQESEKEAVFDVDITRPLENPFISYYLKFWHEMEAICKEMTFEGRPVDLAPWALVGTDGPVTVACNLRGTDFLMDLVAEPDYADRLMNYIMDAALNRRKAFYDYWGDRLGSWNGMADDSIAMLSTDMVKERVIPVIKRFYDTMDASKAPKTMHLCGDSTRHFPALVEALGIRSIDTGFPVDHGALRTALGPNVEIMGGVEVARLCGGSADEVFDRTQEILLSGVKEGGRFILRDANNLPPCCPHDNLAAMYAACREFGGIDA